MTDAEADAIIERYAADILASEGMGRERGFVQHGTVSAFEHSCSVARAALRLAARLDADIDVVTLVRGALLHDYFGYDWHLRETAPPHHAFLHPRYAAENAAADFQVEPEVDEVIRRHMFPLVPIPPRSREAWIVCLADKAVATGETYRGIRARLAGALGHAEGHGA